MSGSKHQLNFMKSITILCLCLLSNASYGQKKAEVSPKKSIAKVILTGKYDYSYYALSEKSNTIYEIEGPGVLTLNFRVRIGSDQLNAEPFRIKYIRSEKNVNMIDVPSLLSGNLKLKSKSLEGNPTRLHKVEISVPPGKHSYKFYKYKTAQKVYLRAIYEAFPKPTWKELIPTSTCDKKDVNFIKSGKIKSYHEITKQTGFDFSVADSTQLRIIVRPEFSYQMLEEIILKIRLQNISTGESKVFKLNSNKSNLIEFVSDKKMTPGTSSVLYIDLDKPNESGDSYSVTVVSGAKSAVVRVSIDKNLLN